MRRLCTRKRAWRLLKYGTTGAVMTGINAAVLAVLVGAIGLLPAVANVTRFALTTQIHFCMHRFFTWRGDHAKTPWQQWYRFQLFKVVDSALGQLAFIGLTTWTDLHYLVVYLACAAGLGPGGLLLLGRRVFTSATTEAQFELDAPVS